MTIYALTIFVSAVLLFQVQLIIAKYLLPWFGGTPTVWSTCMLFFQVMLTGGYAYSYAIVRSLSARKQSRVHLILLSVAIMLLFIQMILWQSPLLPDPVLKHAGSDLPIIRILALLMVSVGLPFFILSTTSTLLQVWFNRAFPKRSPYKLFALSNAGSLLGLLSYPFLVEPNLGLSIQANVWLAGYVIFTLCCGFIAFKAGRILEIPPSSTSPSIESDSMESSGESGQATWLQRILWLALTAGASIVLLATTNQVGEEVAVIPFLWVMPLSIYLLTFILSFSSRYFYWRPLFVVGGIVGMYLVSSLMFKMLSLTPAIFGTGILDQLLVYYAALFICCMLCHGELVRIKPGTRYLTQFYLSVSIGGATGGIFVGLIAPTFFQGLWELYIGYFICGLAVLIAVFQDRKSLLNFPVFGWVLRVPAVAIIILLAVGPFFLLLDRLPQTARNLTLIAADKVGFTKYLPMINPDESILAIRRNFYGILRVLELSPQYMEEHSRYLYHGQTIHGFQLMGKIHYLRKPTSYFTASSGIARAITNHPRYIYSNPRNQQLRVGVVGLGAGTLAVYGRKSDYYCIYEINPAMVELAASEEGYFRFVPDSRAEVDIVTGDARISMEHEESQQFDVLALDAFSGDAPPTHLLTREAFSVYMRHMREGGIIGINITNRYINFRPLIWKLAGELGFERLLIKAYAGDNLAYDNDWILLTKDEKVFQTRALMVDASPPLDDKEFESIRLWTDDYSNLYQLLM